MTAIAGSVFTAAQFNTFIRDNLNECPASKAASPSGYFVTSATNQLVERVGATASLNVPESTTSTTLTDLTTIGPSVTVTTGSSALIIITAEVSNNTASQAGRVGVDITGATTEAPDGNHVLREETNGTAEFNRSSVVRLHTTLTPGANTFKLMYAATANTASFNFRNIAVIPY
jgi:hypothetical protein